MKKETFVKIVGTLIKEGKKERRKYKEETRKETRKEKNRVKRCYFVV